MNRLETSTDYSFSVRKWPLVTSGLKRHLCTASQSISWIPPTAKVGFSKSCSEKVLKRNKCITVGTMETSYYSNVNLKTGYGKLSVIHYMAKSSWTKI